MNTDHLSEEESLLVLIHCAKIPKKSLKQLLLACGGAKSLLSSAKGMRINGMENWENNALWQKDLEAVHHQGVQLITESSPNYPKTFEPLNDPPLLLYCKGQLLPTDRLGVSIVGTRNASIYGLEACEAIATQLSKAGFVITSGLARGIDTKAHLAALRYGRTIAFIGSGLSCIYPGENAELAQEISRQGACISEVPMHTSAQRYLFPKRNRLVSALSQAVLLCEAALKSGAMITMRLAKEQGKACFSLPGRIDMPSFEGNHHLIYSGNAKLISSAVHLIEELKPPIQSFHPPKHLIDSEKLKKNPLPSKKTGENFLLPLNEEEAHLLKLIPNEEIQIEAIKVKSKLSIHRLATLLSALVMKEYLKEYPGKIYKKISRSK